MNISSTFWMVLIAVGALVVAVANIQYNSAREAENRKAKSDQAKALLHPELERNQALLGRMRTAIESGDVPTEPFDTTAWKTISGSELVLGLPNENLANLLEVYRLLNQANDLLARVLESTVGIMSALGNSAQTRQLFLRQLSSVIDRLDSQLKPLIEWSKESV